MGLITSDDYYLKENSGKPKFPIDFVPDFENIGSYEKYFEGNQENGLLSCKFRKGVPFIDKLQTLFQKNLINRIGSSKYSDIKIPLSYILGELIDNITDHSGSPYGYMSACYDKSGDSLYLCIGDNGITIPASYERKRNETLYRMAASDTAMALKFSTEGLSTKNLPQHRGYGLSTTIEMIAGELGGSFMIISGSGVYINNNTIADILQLPTDIGFDGTMIIMKIPVKKINNESLYKIISR